jgi:hypothetical protein
MVAAVDKFYGARGSTKLTGFRVHGCKKLSSGRFRCNVSWQKKPYTYTGSVTMGNVNAKTGHFRFRLLPHAPQYENRRAEAHQCRVLRPHCFTHAVDIGSS